MPVNSTHPLYDATIDIWEMCRTFSDGSKAVKRAAATYLPNFFGTTPEQLAAYNDYKARALYTNVTGATLNAWVGATMRKPPTLSYPAPLEVFVNDMFWSGAKFPAVLSTILNELLLVGRIGILIDRPKGEGGQLRLCLYRAEDVINWAIDENDRLVWAILRENKIEQASDDRYLWNEETRYRELLMEDGRYIQRVYAETSERDGEGEFVLIEEIIPDNRGEPLDYMPFFIMTPAGETTAIDAPPIYDIVEISASHYRTSADLEHGRHFQAVPTFWVSGMAASDLDGAAITLGSTKAFMMPSEAAKCGFAEVASNFEALRAALEEKEEKMARLGARLIGAPMRQAETATAAQIRAGNESNTLMQSIDATERAGERILEIGMLWENVAGDGSVGMNRDFVNTPLNGQELTALLQAYQGGGMSLPTLLWNIQQGERLNPNITIEDEMALIETTGATPFAE